MDDDPYDVIAINRAKRYSVLNNGVVVPWEQMLDRYFEETDDVSEAKVVVHPLPDGSWVHIDLSEWVDATLH